MHPRGHHLTGAATGAIIAGIARFAHPGFDAVHLGALVLAGWFGGVAPDRLEFFLIRRHRWCPHRTITHWGIPWFALLGLAIYFVWVNAANPGAGGVLSWLLLGFFAGGIVHLLLDWPNPTGIPWWLPFRRQSLGWWRSGGPGDILISIGFLLAAYTVWSFP